MRPYIPTKKVEIKKEWNREQYFWITGYIRNGLQILTEKEIIGADGKII